MKNKETKVKVIISVVFTVLVLGFTGFLLLRSFKGSDFVIDEELSQLEISGGLYGKTIEIDDSVIISMVDPIEITRRTNGSSIGNVKSGSFTLVGDVPVYLNLGNSTHDWIAIIDGEDRYYINLKDEQETIDLYNDLLDLQD
ncbi:hypothetical protein [Mariniplasma anaerobium]|uniref:Bacterial Pleckstrin homology domain-containing protein n=1 Tax=Mariniplasma anaerobium TaxID=2735436 RepID=A0A7U9THB9_9MOLU|nr:hypothetical protein [Mariniplasma anaerobium]BCR35250.1 hypothetical protein MPAN_001430 [Mariniplasma anaerobium]